MEKIKLEKVKSEKGVCRKLSVGKKECAEKLVLENGVNEKRVHLLPKKNQCMFLNMFSILKLYNHPYWRSTILLL